MKLTRSWFVLVLAACDAGAPVPPPVSPSEQPPWLPPEPAPSPPVTSALTVDGRTYAVVRLQEECGEATNLGGEHWTFDVYGMPAGFQLHGGGHGIFGDGTTLPGGVASNEVWVGRYYVAEVRLLRAPSESAASHAPLTRSSTARSSQSAQRRTSTMLAVSWLQSPELDLIRRCASTARTTGTASRASRSTRPARAIEYGPRVAWTVDESGVTLAAFVKARSNVAWSVAKRHASRGKVFVDGTRVTAIDLRLAVGQAVELRLSAPRPHDPEREGVLVHDDPHVW